MKLPQIKNFDDYHEIDNLDYYIRSLGLKCKELNINYDDYNTSPYLGIIYKGNLKSKGNKNFLKNWKKKHYNPKYISE